MKTFPAEKRAVHSIAMTQTVSAIALMAAVGISACADVGADSKAEVADALVAALQACAEHDRLAETLARRFGETPVWIGLRQDGAVVEIFASADGGWTQTLVAPNGLACVTASGIGSRPQAPDETGTAM